MHHPVEIPLIFEHLKVLVRIFTSATNGIAWEVRFVKNHDCCSKELVLSGGGKKFSLGNLLKERIDGREVVCWETQNADERIGFSIDMGGQRVGLLRHLLFPIEQDPTFVVHIVTGNVTLVVIKYE